MKVVVVTNGESFRYAARLHFKTVILSPSYYLHFGEQRQKETLSAMKLLGLSPSNVIFLGYPDSALCQLWDTYWEPNNLYKHNLLKTTYSPFPNIFHKHAPYCGASVLADMKKILLKYKPRYVFIPSPEDAHPTHWAVNCFSILALEELRGKLSPFPHIYTYLVHRGPFPSPRGLNFNWGLYPPQSLLNIGLKWVMLPLEPEEIELKFEAIKQYKTQMVEYMKKYLLSFARSNELFSPQRLTFTIPRVEKGRIKVDGKMEDWEGIPPLIIDPERDTLLRRIEGSADIKRVFACEDSSNLFFFIETREKPHFNVRYFLHIWGFAGGVERRLRLNKEIKPLSKDSEGLEVAIPLWVLRGDKHLFIGVTSIYRGIKIDKTAYVVADINR